MLTVNRIHNQALLCAICVLAAAGAYAGNADSGSVVLAEIVIDTPDAAPGVPAVSRAEPVALPARRRRQSESWYLYWGFGFASNRSEERRVGKECKYRWSPEH